MSTRGDDTTPPPKPPGDDPRAGHPIPSLLGDSISPPEFDNSLHVDNPEEVLPLNWTYEGAPQGREVNIRVDPSRPQILLIWGDQYATMSTLRDDGYTTTMPSAINPLLSRLMITRMRMWADAMEAGLETGGQP